MGALTALPSSYDLRTTGRLTPIRDQGSFGTCWAFAGAAALEAAYRRKFGTEIDVSDEAIAALQAEPKDTK